MPTIIVIYITFTTCHSMLTIHLFHNCFSLTSCQHLTHQTDFTDFVCCFSYFLH